MMNTVENQQYYIYNPYIEELNKSQSIGTQLPSMASEFLNPNVKARPRCSISPINTTDLIEASNLSVCNPSLVISDSSASCSNDSGFQSSILAPSVSFNSSPYLYPTAPIPYSLPKPTAKYYSSSTPARPTPQRKAVNFHNITDLATSSDSSCSLSGNSTSSSVDESNASTCQLNEQLKQISQSFNIINKENFEPVETKRKPRTNIDNEKKRMLEWCYNQAKYPSTEQIETICRTLRLDESVVRIWFQNKRARSKQKDRQQRRAN